MTATPETRHPRPASTRAALDRPGRRWGQSYDLAAWDGTWLARRPGDGATLTAPTPDDLHALIAADHAARPVTSDCGRRR